MDVYYPLITTNNEIMIGNYLFLGWAGLEFWRAQRNIVEAKDVFDVPVHPRL